MRLKTGLMGQVIPVVVQYEDHRNFNGVPMPWRTISSNEYMGRLVAQTESIKIDGELPTDLFVLPSFGDRGNQ